MRRSGLLLSRKFVIGILIWTVFTTTDSEALRGSAVVLQAKTKGIEQKAETDEENNNAPAANVTKPRLTGIPQIDYVLDPNLPRELNGHNLTDYPFYNAVPEDIDFKCDGLHDGFYASVPHKCQVYHHCLFGTRYDFLCANYTAFDQKTFICHFVSEVDCDNSPKYFKRNEALYKEAAPPSTTTTTTTPAPSTTTTSPPPVANNGGTRHGGPMRRRRPHRQRRPMYEYYYDDDEYADTDYYDDEVGSLSHRRVPHRKYKDTYGNENKNLETDYDSHVEQPKPSVRPTNNGNNGNPGSSVFERPRTPPKIRRPVPKNERDKYDYSPKQLNSNNPPSSSEKPSTTAAPKTKPAAQPADDEYYEDEEEYEYEEPKAVKSKHHADYDFPTGFEDTRRYMNRHRNRMPARQRAEMYDDYDIKERPSRINRRKEYNSRYDDRPRNVRPMHRNKNPRYEEEPHKYAQSSYKKRISETEYRNGNGRRAPEPKRPAFDDEYYYDDEEREEEILPKRNRRPNQKVPEKPKTTVKTVPQSKERVNMDDRSLESPKHKANNQRNAKSNASENEVPKVSPTYNEISTTEALLLQSVTPNQKHFNNAKTIKIVNNSLKEELDESGDTYTPTEAETKMFSTQMKPVEVAPIKYVHNLKNLNPNHRQSEDYSSESTLKNFRPSQRLPEFAPQPMKKDKRPSDYEDRPQNKTVTPVRHFVVTNPSRKPSHFGSVSLPVNNYREEYRNEEKLKLPEPIQKQPLMNEYYKAIQYAPNQNTSYSVNYRNYMIPVSHEQSTKQTLKPVKEEHLSENLNIINSPNYYNNGFISEPKPFANEATKSTSPPQNYRQDHRLFNNGERLYTTNAISFPQHPPSNYDITAPGPSGPAEEPSAPEKKYSELPAYTSNADYDVTYNDALQPSTLHPVRRYPSTSFYVQPQRAIVPRLPSEYAFNESAFNTLSRSQNRYK